MKPFAYAAAADLETAVALLTHTHGSRPLAGGTDLIPLIKAEIVEPDTLIDLKRADGLHDRIEITDRETIIGALASLSEIERHPGLRAAFPALTEAAGLAASPQLRNMATIGGNLLQRSRCWYYRSSAFPCWLKDGEVCFARQGENQHHAIVHHGPCVSASPSDPAAALLALDASVAVQGANGARLIPLLDFFAEPTEDRRTETTLAADEVITDIRIPAPAAGARSHYLKAMDRKVWAFALVGVAVSLTLPDGRIAQPRIALTGVSPIPIRVTAAEQILDGQSPSEQLLDDADSAALTDAQPLAKNAYKVPLAKALIARALSEVIGT